MKSAIGTFFALKLTVPLNLVNPLLAEFERFSDDEKKFFLEFIRTTSVEDETKGRVVTAEITFTVPLYDKDRLIANIKRRCEKEKCALC